MTALTASRSCAALILAAAASAAFAALGDRADSIAADGAALAAARGVADARPGYRIERLDSAARTVREYVDPSGVVFAVSWEGLSHPDLTAVLGAYAAPVRRALAQETRRGPRRPRRIESGGAVVETWGHMRSVHGRAWIPALVPAGVTLDEIK
jgi:hypothetical protein